MEIDEPMEGKTDAKDVGPAPEAPALVFRSVTVRFGAVTALDALDLEVRGGEITALVGPNGAGKTTTLRVTAGLVRPAAGSVAVFGHDPVAEPVAARRRLALLPDRPVLPAELTVRELLVLRAALYDLRGEAAAVAAEAVAGELGIDELLDRRAGTLSHGQAQRAALAAVLLHSPQLILVDEPMTALDLEAQTGVREVLGRCARDGASVLMTTHTVGHVAALADRVLRMERGRITAGRAGTRDVEELEGWILAGSS